MRVLGKRLITYLKTDAALVALLDDSSSIFMANAPVRKKKLVVVHTNVGQDDDWCDTTSGTILVESIVARSENDAASKCLNIADRVDTVINKKELELTSTPYTVHIFVRQNCTGVLIDNETQEYYCITEYKYIISN